MDFYVFFLLLINRVIHTPKYVEFCPESTGINENPWLWQQKKTQNILARIKDFDEIPENLKNLVHYGFGAT